MRFFGAIYQELYKGPTGAQTFHHFERVQQEEQQFIFVYRVHD